MKYQNGEEFLNAMYQDMHMEDGVMFTADKRDTPVEKIGKYMDRLERVHEKAMASPHKMERLKKAYYNRYVIKELPESYVRLQQRIARERGYGEVNVTDEIKEAMLLQVQKDQKMSLDSWIEYLSSDDAMYPMWFKHYAFRGMLKLGQFDKEKREFSRRSKTTTEPYVELNREVLAKVYDTLSKEVGTNDEISEEVKKALENGESFKKLYEYYLKNMDYIQHSEETDGIWVKYEQGSDYHPLCESLQGKNTRWCTAGEETAKVQLKNGDFYVYYTKDKNGEYKEPRIAIRMDGHDKIGEVRGIGPNQDLEECMFSIVEKKLDEFSDKESYLKKIHDMKLLTEIDRKVQQGDELSREELSFLYEIDSSIEGFGWGKDPRISEIKSKRNVKKDYAFLYDCMEDNIGTKLSDFDSQEIVAYIGDLTYQGEKPPSAFKSLKAILGSADFRSLTSAEGLENLQSISGTADFKSLTSARGLEGLQNIGLDADFSNLTSARGLESLQNIGGKAYFGKLTSARALENLRSIGISADFRSLISAKNLKKLQNIGFRADFESLTSAEGLESLQTIGGTGDFRSLINAEGLENLRSIGINANFDNLTNAEGLESLQSIGGTASFRNLIKAEGLKKLQSIGKTADFGSLTSAEGLEHLKSIGGSVLFYSLVSASGLGNLQSIGVDAAFDNLINSNGLENLQSIGRDARFENLVNAEGLEKLQSIGRKANFKSLINAKGLEHLQRIDGDAWFESLTSAEGLESLQRIDGDAWFESLTSAEGLESLQTIGGDANFGKLISARGLGKLQRIGWKANFKSLISAEGLESLQNIGTDVHFDSLINAKGLEHLQRIDGDAWFKSLTSAKGLEHLQRIGGHADFPSLTSAEGLERLSVSDNDPASDLLDEGIDDVQNNDRGSIKR